MDYKDPISPAVLSLTVFAAAAAMMTSAMLILFGTLPPSAGSGGGLAGGMLSISDAEVTESFLSRPRLDEGFLRNASI